MSAKRGERILGQYEQENGWRVIIVYADGTRQYKLLSTEAKATRFIELTRASLATEEHTTATALD